MDKRPARRAAPELGGAWLRQAARPMLLVLTLVGVGLAGRAWAETGTRFSQAEQAIIARNASLRDAFATAPATVRRALDALESARAGQPRAAPPIEPELGVDDFDPAEDPDLAELQRVSPEAAHDIFQVLKLVATTTRAPPPRSEKLR